MTRRASLKGTFALVMALALLTLGSPDGQAMGGGGAGGGGGGNGAGGGGGAGAGGGAGGGGAGAGAGDGGGAGGDTRSYYATPPNANTPSPTAQRWTPVPGAAQHGTSESALLRCKDQTHGDLAGTEICMAQKGYKKSY